MTNGSADCLPTGLPERSPLADLYGGALTVGDPYPIYQRMRDQRIIDGPGSGPAFMHVSRYDDVHALLRYPAAGSDARRGRAYTDQTTSGALSAADRESLELRSFLHLDPPDHTRLRRLGTKAFTPRRMVELRPMVQRIVDEAIENAAERGSLDVVGDLAYPLPVQVICHLLGVPVEDLLGGCNDGREQLCCFDPTALVDAPTAVFDGARRRRDRTLGYYAKAVAERRGHPGNDLISALIAARHDGDRLSDDELVNTIRLMFVGGHETTVGLIANGALALLRHPDQLELLRLRPELWGEAIEEIIRFDTPFQFVQRTATADIELDGATIAAGTQLILWLGAANRDPGAFVDPDRFDITRQNKRHLGFGGGIHACMGAPLARMQAELALRAIVERLEHASLAAAPPVYHDDAVHALRSLPITFTSVQQASTALVSS
jgi:pimeloyl-[acyl-carrier protein] synthase